MKLRPHHLLCTQSFSGKGYSEEFVLNMTYITNQLRTEKSTVVEIVFSTDDLCEKCPNMLHSDQCKDNEKVKTIDKKVIEYFGLEEKSYIYQDLVRKINSSITESIMQDICSSCNWYAISSCKSRILKVE